MSRGIGSDLSRKLQEDLGAVLNAQTNIAAVVLDPADLVLLMMEAAVMMVASVSATIAGMAADDAETEALFDSVVGQIAAMVAHKRSDSIARTIAHRKACAA